MPSDYTDPELQHPGICILAQIDALAALTVLFFFLLVFLNGFIGNWLLRQGNSDSVVSTLFFDGPPESYNTWPYRESYLPLETVGQAVEFASKVADDISLTRHESASALVPDSDAYADSAASPYRMVRSKKRSKRAQTANFAKQTVNHFVLGISMTGIGSFLWLLLTLPLWCALSSKLFSGYYELTRRAQTGRYILCGTDYSGH